MDKLLPLLESVLFVITPDGAVRPLSRGASSLWSALASGSRHLPALFGVEGYSALRQAAESGVPRDVELPMADRGSWRLRWQFQLLDEQVLANGINWLPIGELLENLSKESLLYREMVLNLVPGFVIEQIRKHKAIQPKAYRESTIAFVDVVSFSRIAFQLDPVSLLRRLDDYFSRFDQVMKAFRLEKIKTIGDAYMFVSGIPQRRAAHAVDACLAALHLLDSAQQRKSSSRPSAAGASSGDIDTDQWRFRVGLHSGPCISGVLGSAKYLFDVWGDSVNIAARMEGVGEPGHPSISGATYELIKDYFDCTLLGRKAVKNIGEVDVYRVNGLRPELAADARALTPNPEFLRRYLDEQLRAGGRANADALAPFYQRLLAGSPPV